MTQGATNLEIKRSYMEMRAELRYVFAQAPHPEIREASEAMGSREIQGAASTLDGRLIPSYCLDMGPDSVEGWPSWLVGKELGVAGLDERVPLFDAGLPELVLAGGAVQLTPLEFGVMRSLDKRGGKVASRVDLLDEVWGHTSDATSNVVDTVVHGLRKKLGDTAPHCERLDRARRGRDRPSAIWLRTRSSSPPSPIIELLTRVPIPGFARFLDGPEPSPSTSLRFKDERTGHVSVAQAQECAVRFGQRKPFDVCLNLNLGGDGKEFPGIVSGVVGNAPDLALEPEVVI